MESGSAGQIKYLLSHISYLLSFISYLLSFICSNFIFSNSLCEISVYEYRDLPSVVGGAGDVQVRRAHHEVHVGDGVVEAPGLQLVLAHLLAALQAGIRLAEGDVAGGVLVEQRVLEQDLLVGDGAVVGHQGHLTEVAGPLVHGDGGLEGLLPLLRADLHDLPVLDHKVELVNDGAVVA